MTSELDPYHQWLGIPREEQPPNHYRLLAVQLFEADPNVISSLADQRMAHLRTFAAGRNAMLSQRLLNEVAAARVCLLNPARKAAYDAQLQARLGRHSSPPVNGPAQDFPGYVYDAPVQPTSLPVPIAPQAAFPPPEVIDSCVIPELALSDFRGDRGHAARTRTSRAKQSGFDGPRTYTIVVLVIGVVGLATIIWVRANKWQIQLVVADQTTRSKRATDGKQLASANSSSKERRDQEAEGDRPGRARSEKSIRTSSAGAKQMVKASQDAPTDKNPGANPLMELPDAETANFPPANRFPMDATQQSARDMTRIRWTHSKGRFEHSDGNRWQERAPDGYQQHFLEVLATKDFIELHLDSGNTRVKLYSDRCDVSFRPFTSTQTLYRGSWESEKAVGADNPIESNLDRKNFPKEPASPDANGWVDLLDWAEGVDWVPKGIDWNDACERPPTKDGVTLKSRSFNRFPLSAIIDGDYEMEVEFTRHAGAESVDVFFPLGIHNMHLELGGAKGTVGGVHWIAGKHAFNGNPTTRRPCSFTNNDRHTIKFRVRHSGNTAAFNIDWDNAQDYITWQGPYNELTNSDGSAWKLSMVRRPWLGAFESRVTFHKARVRMTSGEIRRDFVTFADREKDMAQGFVRLIDLPANSPTVGWGRYCVNQIPIEHWPSDDERAWPLVTLHASVCKDYYGAHAPSRLKVPIPKNARSFSATGYNQSSRTVNYLVYVDGTLKFESGVNGIEAISVPIPAKATLLELVVDSAGPADFDHSYWCNPRFDGPKQNKLPFTVAMSSVGFGAFTHNEPCDIWAAPPLESREAEPCDEFLFAHANSSVTYAVPPGMRRFEAIGYCVRSNSVKFQIWADARMMYESPKAGIVPIDVRLPVGVKTIELRADSLGNSGWDWSLWCYPRLHRN